MPTIVAGDTASWRCVMEISEKIQAGIPAADRGASAILAATLCENPNGIAASSPRLARSAYLGFTFQNENNRNAVVAVRARTVKTKWPQPRCGWEFFADADPG